MRHHFVGALFAGVVAGLAIACGSDAKPPPAAPGGTMDAPTAGQTQVPSDLAGKEATKGNIRISDKIRQACGLTDTETYFAYDSANVSAAFDAILGKLATCFTTGPLAGQGMKLVGHADPRGDEEYNMVLGGKRAENVKRLLVGKRVERAKIVGSSRGEIDATGTNDASWARDRRVDVMLDE